MKDDFNIQFNESKTINAVLYIVERIERKDFHKIFKILYFSDRELFADYGKTISGDHYIAMTAGPVPSNLHDIFKSVRGDGFFKHDGRFSQYFNVVNKNFIVNKKEANLKALSKKDIEYLNNSISKYANLSCSAIKKISHDYAWENTVRDDTMSFENILLERGESDEYIHILKDRANARYFIDSSISEVLSEMKQTNI
jgi:uncharacterized phage-associated protein